MKNFIKNIFPSRTQWRKWTLPNQAGYLGACVGMFSLVITIIVSLSGKSEVIIVDGEVRISDISQLLKEHIFIGGGYYGSSNQNNESKYSVTIGPGDPVAEYVLKGADYLVGVDGKKPSQLDTIPTGSINNNFKVYEFTSLSVPVFVEVVAVVDGERSKKYRYDMDYEDQVAYQNRLINETKKVDPLVVPKIENDDIPIDRVRVTNEGLYLDVGTPKGLRKYDYDIQISRSIDGARYENSTVIPFEDSDTTFIWLNNRRDSSVKLGPFIKKNLFENATKDAFYNKHRGEIDHGLSCARANCRVQSPRECFYDPPSLYLASNSGDMIEVYQYPNCEDTERKKVDDSFLCRDNNWKKILIDDELDIKGEIRFANLDPIEIVVPAHVGEYTPVKLKGGTIVYSNPRRQFPHAFYRVRSQEMGKDEDVFSLLGFSIDHIARGQFILHSAFNSCQKFSQILVDFDGFGMTETEIKGDRLEGVDLRGMFKNASQISYMVKQEDDTHGPFTFSFSPEKVIGLQAQFSEPPRLRCGSGYCTAPNINQALSSWLDVKSISYGSAPDTLDAIIEVKFGSKELLKKIWDEDYSLNETGGYQLMKFEIPKDWASLFYKINFDDGRQSDVLRIKLK